MRSQLHFLTVLFAAALLACTAAEAATLEDQCNKYINKVSMCLTYDGEGNDAVEGLL